MGKSFAVIALLAAVAYYYVSQDTFDPETIKDKRVLITGSSSGIGEHLAYEYAKLGARIVLTARRAELLEKVAQRCRSLGARDVHVVPANMGDPEHRTRVVKATEKALGGLDHLILNHADIAQGLTWKGSPENITTLINMMNVNFISFVDLASQFLPALKESSGNVGIVSSMAGKVGMARSESYSASKFAMQGFFPSWRQELIHQGADVSFTMCVLGPISTDHVNQMVKEAFPEREEIDMIGVVKPDDTAVAILHAVATRAREMYYGRIACILTLVHKLFPNFVENQMSNYFYTNFPLND